MLADLQDRWRRARADAETTVLVGLVALLVLVVAVGSQADWLPYSIVLVPVFVASQSLGPRRLPLFTVLALGAALVLVVEQPPGSVRDVVRVAVVLTVAVLVLVSSHHRVGLGVPGRTGETMLVELRDRIIAQGRVEDVPAGWRAGSTLQAAGGTAFAGDFLVADVEADRLRVAVVDVSGQGIAAGTRSLLLSGAMGALLAALPGEELLPAANRFLLGQDWEEGFATAVHLDLDLTSGEVALRSAGHPPAILVRRDRPGWELLDAEGPALGLLADLAYPARRAHMEDGDVLLLYTDGVVEHPRRDISDGIEALASRARQRLDDGRGLAAEELIEGLGRRGDDRALLVVRREVG